MPSTTTLENYFSFFRNNIIGQNHLFDSPFGKQKIVYADWTASGRAYQPIEDCLQKQVMPFLANTHTETTATGTLMTKAYNEAKVILKQHVNASSNDALVFCGSGMTAAVTKLQRMLGMRIPERIVDYVAKSGHPINKPALRDYLALDETLKPIVFITHMEHHSNQTSWLETIADVEIIEADKNGNVDLEHLKLLLQKYRHRKNKIAAVTACSNVTGIQTPYHCIAKLIHKYGGLCFVDFACSAPYVNINMHPQEPGTHLDAIYFSPHKFLGGPGTPGVLVFTKKIYTNTIPDQPGGGTILYSNPWKEHEYIADIEQREDGGTPPILQAIKAAMCVRLKEQMGVGNILRREKEILCTIFERLTQIKNIMVLESHIKERLGVISFMVRGAHHNLIVKILNDRFGIQTRGGCSCAGTYGHKLLHVDKAKSFAILQALRAGNLLAKPGWVRLSIHPTMSNAQIDFIMDAIELTTSNFNEWGTDYNYNPASNQFTFKGFEANEQHKVDEWFNVCSWDKTPQLATEPVEKDLMIDTTYLNC